MKKTSIYLDAELDRDLDLLASRNGISRSEAIRRAVREATRDIERPRFTAIGVGRGPGDVAAEVDRHLRETGFGER